MKHQLTTLLAICAALPLTAHAQQTTREQPHPQPALADPFAPAPPRKGGPQAGVATRRPAPPVPGVPGGPGGQPFIAKAKRPAVGGNLLFRYEHFSLPLPKAATLMRQGEPDAGLYELLVKMTADGAAIQEDLTVVSSRSGQKATAESIVERIYPTEYDSPNTPKAYETRNIGVTLEVEAIVNPQSGLIDLRIAPERVNFLGNSEYGAAEAPQEMPEFGSQRLSTSTEVAPGVPRLLGTVNHSGGTTTNKEGEKRIWFAFVTVSHVK